jgi:hypothetical protein
VSVFVQLVCVHFPSDSLIIQAHITLCFFPPRGALKTSSVNFFYSSSSFRFYIIYVYDFFSAFLPPRFTPAGTRLLPLFLWRYLCHFWNLKQKLMHVLYIPHTIVIPRYCSVLPAKQYWRIIYTQLMCAPTFTQFYLDTHTHTHTHKHVCGQLDNRHGNIVHCTRYYVK